LTIQLDKSRSLSRSKFRAVGERLESENKPNDRFESISEICRDKFKAFMSSRVPFNSGVYQLAETNDSVVAVTDLNVVVGPLRNVEEPIVGLVDETPIVVVLTTVDF
jgi:hypothetical protein